jgi:3-methyladenine DNA glycosylase AlkD
LTSEVTRRANEFVAQRLPAARALGEQLSALIDDPERFVRALRRGLTRLADPAYAREQERIAPGSGAVFGVRWPLLGAVEAGLNRPLADASAAVAISLAQRLAREAEREARLFALVPLRRALPADPERTWQLLRRLARGAQEWVSVDSLAELYALGILAERFRWAELEQLVYSSSRWERRLVGSTVATIPLRVPRGRRRELADAPGLVLVGNLIGDSEAEVQKALSWALRSWLQVDPAATSKFIADQARLAAQADDGLRAWVVRDALTAPGLPAAFVAEVRRQLAGIRRRPAAAPTSTASEVARGFVRFDELADRATAEQGKRAAMIQ